MEILTKYLPFFRLTLFLLTLPVFGFAQQFPVNNQKIVQGVGTTAQGISSYSSSPPTTAPTAATFRHVTSIHMDTVLQIQYIYKRPRWYPISVVRRATPPPATASSGSTTIDYTESIWQSTADSLTYYYEEENACWQPVGTVVRDTTPVSLAATGTSAAVCYEYSLWYNSTNDSLYAYTAGAWLPFTGGGGGTFNSFNIAGDTGSDVVTDGQTVTIAGGYGINTAETGGTVTVTADTSQLATQYDITGLTPITASNGLTKTGNDIKLGGSLTGATTITGAGFNFTETGLGYYQFEADSAIWRINGEKFIHMGRIRGTTGDDYGELAVGYRAGANLPTWGAKANTLFGSFAGENLNGTVSVGAANAFFGHKSGQLIQTGSYNTLIGVAAGANTGTSISIVTGIGHHALINATSGNHIAIGQSTLQNTSGAVGIAIGNQALSSNTNAGYNIGVGTEVMQSTTTGGESTVIGHAAFKTNISGSKNVGLGYFVGRLTTGSNNIFLGWSAGETATTGSNNIILAYGGALSSVTASNELNIGNAIYGTGLNAATKVGLFGVNEATPARTLHVTLNNAGTTTAGIGLRLAGQTSATAGTGFGFLQETALETSAGTNAIASTIGTIYTDATTGSEDADYVVNLMDGGSAAAEKFRVDSDGNIKASAGFKDTSGDLGTSGQVLSSTATGTDWIAASSASGTVTSVGLALPAIFSVSGSPVTTSGTLTATLATQTASTLFAGPASGSAATPTFRLMVPLDLPAVASSFFWDNTNGRLGLGTATPNQQLELTGNFRIPAMTFASQNGVIYKAGNRWLHDFRYGNNGTVTTDGNNIFLGESAGNFTMGSTATVSDQASYNIGIGRLSLSSNTIGKENVGVGVFSLFSNTTGTLNSAFGVSALELNTTGGFNMAVGRSALGANTTGSNSVAIGALALRGNTTGSDNIGIGSNAGRYIADGSTANQTGGTSVFIGSDTKAASAGNTNQIVIGYNATGLGSNTAVLGNSSITTTALRGSVGISNTSPQRTLHVTGEARITDLTTDTPTGIVGADADGDLGLVALGAGLSIGSGTLSGAFLPLTLTGATEVNTAGQNLYFRDAAGYPFTFMNSNYFLAASGANNYIDVGSTASNVKVISDGLIELNSSVNTSMVTAGRLLIDSDSIVIDATLPVNTNATSVLVRDAVTKRLEEKTVASFATTAPSEEILFGTGTGTDTDAGLKYRDDTGNRLTSANGKLDLNTTSEPQVSTVAKFAEDRFLDVDPDFEPTNDSTVVAAIRVRHRGENGTGTRRPYIFNEGTPGTTGGGDIVFSVFHEGIKLWRRNNSIHNNVWGILQPPNSRLDIGWTSGVSFASFYRTADNVDTTKWFDFKSTGELFAHAYRVSGESQSTSFTGLVTVDDLGNHQRTNTATVRDSLFIPGAISTSTDGSGDVTVSHSNGDATFNVQVTVTGTTFFHAQVHTKTGSDFKVRFFDAAGAAVTATAVTADYTLTDN